MGEKVLEVQWSHKAEKALESIFDFYAAKSVQAAVNVITEIVLTAEGIKYTEQYQIDEFDSEFRRAIVLHFKIYYSVENNRIEIVNIVDTRQSPKVPKNK